MIKAIRVNENNNKLVTASYDLSKLDKYICPMCKGEMIIKQGEIMIPHFSHKKNETCMYYEYSKSESKEKVTYKHRIYEMLKDGLCCDIQNLDIEYITANGLICDVYLESNGKRYGVYIRDKEIELNEYIKINQEYNQEGIVLIWVFTNKVIDDKCILKSGNFFRQLIFKKHLTYMIKPIINKKDNKPMFALCKGMQDTKCKEGIVKYYMFPLVNDKFKVDSWEYSFKVYDEWYKLELGNIKVVRD